MDRASLCNPAALYSRPQLHFLIAGGSSNPAAKREPYSRPITPATVCVERAEIVSPMNATGEAGGDDFTALSAVVGERDT